MEEVHRSCKPLWGGLQGHASGLSGLLQPRIHKLWKR